MKANLAGFLAFIRYLSGVSRIMNPSHQEKQYFRQLCPANRLQWHSKSLEALQTIPN